MSFCESSISYLLLLVIFDQSLHRGLDDASERHAFSLESLFELRTEIVSDRAVEAYGQLVPSVVEADVAHEETAEIFYHEAVDALVFDVLCQERHERCEEAVRHLLTVDALNDIGTCEMEFLLKAQAYVLRQLTLEDVAHEVLAQHGTAALIAKDET